MSDEPETTASTPEPDSPAPAQAAGRTRTPRKRKSRARSARSTGSAAAVPAPVSPPSPPPEPPTLEFRPMQLRDLPAVFELGQRLFTAEKWPTLYRSWDDHELASLFNSDGETCLVAEAGERIVGFALGRIMEKPRSAWRYGWLLWLGVDPAFHRGRVATRLLRRLTELFVENEARIMLVDTDEQNHHALAFFERQGFGQAVRHVYLSRNLDDHPRNIERRFDSVLEDEEE